jgi:hypothetical protein
MTMLHVRLWVGVGVLVSMFACSSSSSPAPVTPVGPTADQACGDAAKARCTRIQTCSAMHLAVLYGDEAACETRLKANCVSALAAPSNANTPTLVAGCTTAMPGWACNDFLIGANPPAACAQSTGSVAAGGPCYAAGQCQSGFCAISTAACGVCAVAPTAGLACTASNQCGPGLLCGSDGNCVVPAQKDATCGAGQVCSPGNLCIAGTCKAIDSTATAGQACGNVSGKTVACASGTCEKAVCVARATDGAACNPSTGPVCEPPAFCVGGTCQIALCK